MSGDFYDALEHRDPAQRISEQGAQLAAQVAHAKQNSPYYRTLLKDIDAAAVSDRAALARLPVTRKAELRDRQAAARPFGGLQGWPVGKLGHIYQSPGPIYEPDAPVRDYWRFARALWAAGLRPGQLVHNSFSYHLTPAGMMVESGAQAIGCPVVPGGVGNTELQLQAIVDLAPACFAGTPSFLKILLDRAREGGLDIGSLKSALVSGEALPPSLRGELKDGGVFVLQCYATADLGLIAYESPAIDGLIVDEGVIVEIVRPGSGEPLADGEVGEVLVTTLNPVYPLLRFATGDLSAVLPGVSPCGRTNQRIRGWMGRADQTTKVRGMFIQPGQISQVAARHPELGRVRLVVTNVANHDEMTLRCEVDAPSADLAAAVATTLQSLCKVRGSVELVAPGTLPNDGKVIADERRYE